MNPSALEVVATCVFALALVHTFSVKYFLGLAHRYPEGSAAENFFHLLGEIEVVFGLWAAVYIAFRFWLAGDAIAYLESLNYTEPAFVFVVLSICSTRPVLKIAEVIIGGLAKLIPAPGALGFYLAALIAGPLLGSFITEPAAMAVTALLLLDRIFRNGASTSLMYATLGLLFVNISIGGTLTPYAAPPILMVAPVWGWDLAFMMSNFGWRGALACVISTSITAWYFRKELSRSALRK